MRPTLPDDLSQIFLGNAKLENMSMVANDFFDLDLVRLIDQGMNDELYEMLQGTLRLSFEDRGTGLQLGPGPPGRGTTESTDASGVYPQGHPKTT